MNGNRSGKKHLFRMIIPEYPTSIFSQVARNTTALGPVLVATNANELKNWEVEIIDENNYRRRRWPKDVDGHLDHAALQQERPADVVGFYGSLTSTIPRIYKLAGLYHSLGAKTIIGGSHAKNLPEEALANDIDIVGLGKGELIIKDLLLAIEKERPLELVKGIALKRDGQIIKTPVEEKFDCRSMPFPDFSLVRQAKIKIYPITWWRGCPHYQKPCEFCAETEEPDYTPAEQLLNLIKYLVKKFGAKYFFLVDDFFGGGRKIETEDRFGLYPDVKYQDEMNRLEAIRLCGILADYQQKNGLQLSFSVQIRLDAAKSPDLLQAMRKAGIDNVFIGYESSIDSELRSMQKGYLSKDMIEWTNIFHRHGFFIVGMFIAFYPQKIIAGEATVKAALTVRERVRILKKFIYQAKIDLAYALLTVPLPGTPLRKRLEQEGRLYSLEYLSWEFYTGQYLLYDPKDGSTPEELQAALLEVMSEFYHFGYLGNLLFNCLIHFPRLVFPRVFTLVTGRVRYLTAAFRQWKKRYFRNASIRVGGSFIIKKWRKTFLQTGFPEKLKKAREALAKKMKK